ncbi:hypothetical protein EMPS_00864 [Entomortierella parvispora]|uniref:Galactose oxidase n=1 Tax=Entomortierella parvispora TaxID=205924 RepID=A0A9P3H2H6_9FUNG|nr:hypothetical protein EMPS_00864 [Entomortierella parvispora]
MCQRTGSPRRGVGSASFFIRIFTLATLCSTLCSIVQSQGFQPTTAWGSASAFVEGQTFVIQGGSNGTFTIPQTFSIDLSSSWDISSVPYRRLLDGPSDYKHSASLLNDHKNWFVLSNGTGLEYTIPPDTWRSLGGSAEVSRTRGLGAATDPDTGMIYVPNGFLVNATTTQMFQFDVINNVLNSVDMHPALVNMVSYAIAWSGQAKKMFLFGGAVSGTNNVNGAMYSWDPINGWALLSPQGTVPSPRRSACMVPAYNGQKMILFGGLTDESNSVLSDIYILDTASLTWSKGKDAGVASARAECSCAMTNDLFVVWGGGGVNTVISSNLTIIYNARTDSWQTNFSPMPVSDPSAPWASSPGALNGKRNIGIIVGPVAAAVVVIALVVGFLYGRRRQRQRSQAPQQLADSEHDKTHSSRSLDQARDGTEQSQQWGTSFQQQHAQHELGQEQNGYGYHDQIRHRDLTSQPSYSQLYTPYTPPILHDYYHEQQLYPRIFQPQVQSQTQLMMHPPLLDELVRSDDPSRQASVCSSYNYYSPTDESPPSSSQLSGATDLSTKAPVPTIYRPPALNPQSSSPS